MSSRVFDLCFSRNAAAKAGTVCLAGCFDNSRILIDVPVILHRALFGDTLFLIFLARFNYVRLYADDDIVRVGEVRKN